jgi:hypothetical protein
MENKMTNSTALAFSTLRRPKKTMENLRKNSSRSCGDLFQISKLHVEMKSVKIEKKKKKFSLRKFFKSSKNLRVEDDPITLPEMPFLKQKFIRSYSKSKVYGNMPILRNREEIVNSGIIVWEEDFPTILSARVHGQ